ncbi:hypothetical protein BH18CHL2_BH18CHL2_07540 [soil metagenome]
MPIVFVYEDPALYTPLDRKPKQHDDPRTLRRARDIEANGRVSVVVDRWDEDWSRLEWVRIDGTAEILEAGDERDRAAAALSAKYPQYAELPLEGRPIVKVTAERVTEWPD